MNNDRTFKQWLRDKFVWVICWLLQHKPITEGKPCRNLKPHYCPKLIIKCARCGATSTDNGWLYL